MSKQQKKSASQTVREIKRKTHRQFSAEEKIRIASSNHWINSDLQIFT